MKIQTPENYDSLWVMRGRPYYFNTKTSQPRGGTTVFSGLFSFILYNLHIPVEIFFLREKSSNDTIAYNNW